MYHAMRCVARLVRMLLGASAIAEKKLACGRKLDILGVLVFSGWAHAMDASCAAQVEVKLSTKGYKCRPTEGKVRRWCECIEHALASDRLRPGEASKLAGRLSWGTSTMFRWVLSCHK